MNEAQTIRTIKALVAKGDHARDKSAQFYTAAGRHLEALKQDGAHKRHALTWEQFVKDKCGISRERADQLIRIADGRTTVEQERADTAQRVMKHSKKRVLANTARELAVVDVQPAAATPAASAPDSKPGGRVTAAELEEAFAARDREIDQLQRAWDAAPREIRQRFAIENALELKALIAEHRNGGAVERAIARSASTAVHAASMK
jgi:hypothetical protein